MMLSTLWVGLSIAMSVDGHPVTAVVPLIAWVLHHRCERRWKVRKERTNHAKTLDAI